MYGFYVTRKKWHATRKKEMDVVLSVPHASADRREGRTHDQRAKSCAAELAAALSAVGVSNAVVANETVARSSIDMNRFASRSTAWRQMLKERMAASKWVVDVHSFPPESHHQLVYLIVDDHGMKYAGLVFHALNDVAPGAVGLYRGETNDIIDQANSMGKKSVLLEWNESKELLTQDLLHRMCRSLADTIKTHRE